MFKKFKRALSALTAAALTVTATGMLSTVIAEETVDDPLLPNVKIGTTVEAEDMYLNGLTVWQSIYENQVPGYSGEGFVYVTSGSIEFEVEVEEAGMYEIWTDYVQILSNPGESRQQSIEINGVQYTNQYSYANTWTEKCFANVRFNEGVNTVKFTNSYGYAAHDTITIKKAEFDDLTAVNPTLSDSKATPEAKSLMAYLCDVYGTGILSGQQTIYGGGHGVTTTIRYDATTNTCVDSDGNTYKFDEADKAVADDGSTFVWKCYDDNGQVYNYNTQNRNYSYNEYDRELKYVKETVGDFPAIQGFDFGANCPCYAWDDGIVERMIDWTNNKNGICTASWHINVPTALADYTLGEPLDFSKTTYSEKCDFSPSNAYTEGTIEYDYYQLCLENLAEQLLRLQEANVPVLFRPLHEADGNYSNGGTSWFWWGKEGPEVYNNLWKFTRKELEEKYGIHNLIWEQNLYAWSDESAAWYSGDEYVDIVGYDKYNTQYNRHDGKTSGPNLDAESGIFWKLHDSINGSKPIALTENDTIPSLDNILIENAGWLYFCPWYDEESSPKFVSGSDYQDIDEFKKIYQSEYCITLSELPENWKTYASGDQPTTDPTDEPTDTPTNPDVDFTPGDVTDDGKINVFDNVALKRHLLYGYEGMVDMLVASAGDVTGDGVEDISDLVLLNKFLLGKDVTFKVYTAE